MIQTKRFSGLEVKSEAKGEVEAIVATLNVVDRDGDVILPGAIGAQRVKLSGWGHDIIRQDAPPVGVGEVRERGSEAVFTGRFFTTTTRGREGFALLRELGSDGEWSIGFMRSTVTEAPMTDGWRAKGAQRVLSRLEMVEVSPVFQPAGHGTRTTSTKQRQAEPPPFDAAAFDRDRQALYRLTGPTVAVQVDPERHAAAVQVASWAAARWGVDPPAVKWYRPGTFHGLGCYCEGEDAIWIRSDVKGREVAGVALHEVSHYARHNRGAENTEELVDGDTATLLKAYAAEVNTAGAALHPSGRRQLWIGARAI